MYSSSSFIVAALTIMSNASVTLCARISAENGITLQQELQKRDIAEQPGEGEQWDDEEWQEDGESDESAVETTVEEDRADGPVDEELVAEDATTSKAVCCKCGKVASNGETVFSCSTGGSCRKCKKYGGQKRAERLPAPSACANGKKGAHSSCRKAFEGSR